MCYYNIIEIFLYIRKAFQNTRGKSFETNLTWQSDLSGFFCVVLS